MALIKCPECEREISDKAEVCIHCGYPINKVGKEGLFQTVLLSAGEQETKVIGTFRKISRKDLKSSVDYINNLPAVLLKGLTYDDAKIVEDMFLQLGADVVIEKDSTSMTRFDFHKKMAEYEDDAKKVHCPKCGSVEIGVTTGGIRMFDGFGGSGSPQNVCKRCGYHWIPRL